MVELFTIEHSAFLNKYFDSIEQFASDTYFEITNVLSSENTCKYFEQFFSREEIAILLVVNKAIFQNIYAFFQQIKSHISFPAFNSLRSALEGIRLFRALYIDKDFRTQYICNDNVDFRHGSDYSFMQKKVNKVLVESEQALRSERYIPVGTPILSNHILTDQNRPASEMHNELSRWSHLLNVNLMSLAHLCKGRLALNITDEYTDNLQLLIKRYTEGTYLLIMDHVQTLMAAPVNKEYLDEIDEMLQLYQEYIDLFYCTNTGKDS